jgi:hypothetical protein
MGSILSSITVFLLSVVICQRADMRCGRKLRDIPTAICLKSATKIKFICIFRFGAFLSDFPLFLFYQVSVVICQRPDMRCGRKLRDIPTPIFLINATKIKSLCIFQFRAFLSDFLFVTNSIANSATNPIAFELFSRCTCSSLESFGGNVRRSAGDIPANILHLKQQSSIPPLP